MPVAILFRKLVPKVDIERKQNESPLEYHKRLVYGKLVDKTLSDMDYTELAELVYGQAYSSDVARRMLYGSRRTLELMDAERVDDISDSSILSELDEKMIELRKERQKFYDQRREFNKLVSADGREEHLYATLEKSAAALSDSVGVMYADREPISLSFDDTEAVLVFSDWHYGLKTTNVFNTYNKDICVQRVKSVVDSAVERILLHRCRKLHIAVLGDLYHGAIHTSARVASEELVCEQLMQVSEILAQSIIELSQYVEETDVYFTYGNHARTVQNKSESIHRDNMERIIPWWLRQRLSDYDTINVVEESDNEFVFMEPCGHGVCTTHGDLDSVRQSPKLLATLFQKTYGKNVEYIILGDKHHRESFSELGITSMICGSLCGSDDYANDKRLFSEPEQLLLITNNKCGVDAEYHIKCK